MPEQAPARSSLLFSRDALLRLIIPLVIEQLLLMTVGMADTVMVTTSGEAAVSGVSLVDNINTLIIQVFSALSTGGAVVVSQYLGRQDTDNAKAASKQLLYAMCALSLLLMGAALVLRQHILALIFGRVEADVMENALVYFLLTATAYPFMGIYNAGAALFRAMGNSKVSMFCSLVVNVINITVNAVLISASAWGPPAPVSAPWSPASRRPSLSWRCSTTPTMCSGWRVCCVLSSGVPSSSASYLSASLTVWKTACFRQAS